MKAKQINILLADDHLMMMNALGKMLEVDGRMQIKVSCADGNKALHYLNDNPQEIDVAILDIHMPNLDGLAATPIIKNRYPNIKVIILSMYYTPQIIAQVKAAGADAFIHKADEIDKLIKTIEEVINNEKVFPKYDASITGYTHEVTEDAFMKMTVLSEREKQIARYIRDGLSTPKIAKLLFLSEYTIDTHRKNILQKLSLKSMGDLIRFAIENKL